MYVISPPFSHSFLDGSTVIVGYFDPKSDKLQLVGKGNVWPGMEYFILADKLLFGPIA